jgi:glyoxylase-like metal-dependent hydrolase (beta-lactamase superfamily II)
MLTPSYRSIIIVTECLNVQASGSRLGADERSNAMPIHRLRLRPVTGELDIAPGVRLLELPGHSPGSIGALIGKDLLAGEMP